MDADASDGRQKRTQSPTMEKLETQFSEACQKNFIIFDHSASKRTMVLHPALLNDQSSFTTKIMNDRAGLFVHLQDISDKAVDNLLIYDPPADPSTRRARLLAYRETMESAFATLQKMKADGFRSLDIEAGDGVVACLNEVQGAQNIKKTSGNGIYEDPSEGIKSQEYEDSEGLDALLSSDDDDEDDELNSTGHSPSDATGNNAATCTDDKRDPSKKRKFQMCDPEDDHTDFGSDEADSGQVLMSNCEECQEAQHLRIGGWDLQIHMGHANTGDDFLCRENCLLGTLATSPSRQARSGNRVGNHGENHELKLLSL